MLGETGLTGSNQYLAPTLHPATVERVVVLRWWLGCGLPVTNVVVVTVVVMVVV